MWLATSYVDSQDQGVANFFSEIHDLYSRQQYGQALEALLVRAPWIHGNTSSPLERLSDKLDILSNSGEQDSIVSLAEYLESSQDDAELYATFVRQYISSHASFSSEVNTQLNTMNLIQGYYQTVRPEQLLSPIKEQDA